MFPADIRIVSSVRFFRKYPILNDRNTTYSDSLTHVDAKMIEIPSQ